MIVPEITIWAPDAVHGGHADGAHDAEGDEEHPAVQRLADAGVADPRRPPAELGQLVAVAAVELDEHGAGDVEALGHLRVHLGVEVHALAGDRLQDPPDPLGRQDEQRQHDERQHA